MVLCPAAVAFSDQNQNDPGIFLCCRRVTVEQKAVVKSEVWLCIYMHFLTGSVSQESCLVP